MDTYYKIDWVEMKVRPVKLDKNGIDDDNYPYDKGAHYNTENEAIMFMKAICRKEVVEAADDLKHSIAVHGDAEIAYEAAIKKNARCIELYSFADTHIE